MRRCLPLLVMVWATAAQAENCGGKTLTAGERTACEWRAVGQVEQAMNAAYAQALDASAGLLAQAGVNLAPAVTSTQYNWSKWVQEQCALDSGAIWGEEGRLGEAKCRQSKTQDRIKSLKALTAKLDALSGH